jgi:hypothetical protein
MHVCRTVPEAGLAGRKNGDLLTIAESQGYDVFLTMDKGVEREQNLTARRIAVVILLAKSNRLADRLPHIPACLARLRAIQPGEVIRVDS